MFSLEKGKVSISNCSDTLNKPILALKKLIVTFWESIFTVAQNESRL